MSKLRLRLLKMAEQKVDPATGYYILDDGRMVNPETGEIIEQNSTTQNETNDQDDVQQKLKNVMYEQAKDAHSDYPDPKYLNQWGKVSPLNIIFVDDITNSNNIYSMAPDQAKDFIINKIKDLNKKYGNDKSYGYVSQDYLAKMLSKLRSMKSIDKIVQYVTDAYFKGAGMGMSPSKKNVGVLLNLNNKEALKAILPILTKIANKE